MPGVDFNAVGGTVRGGITVVSVGYHSQFFVCTIIFVLQSKVENMRSCFVFVAKDPTSTGGFLVRVKPV